MELDEHQKLVRKLMEYFESNGIIVTCACSGYIDCKRIKEFVPDVRARDMENELNYIGEAKICDDIHSKHTKKQFLEFSNRTMNKGKSAGKDVPFYILVPERCKTELWKVLDELKLSERENIHVIS